MMGRIKNILRFLFLSFLILKGIQIGFGQNDTGRVRYGQGLTEYGSDKPAHTIYTNPGEDCSTTMNISWATPPGTKWMIELTDETDGGTFVYEYDETLLDGAEDSEEGEPNQFPYLYRCDTFNDIPSVLSDRTKVTEKHIFDKHGYELYDLEPDKLYSYRIVTINDSTGEEEYSGTYRFRTAGADSWKAAVIGDFHHYSPLWKRLDAAMDMVEVLDSVAGGVDWVLSTGDQCAYGGSFNFWTELSEQPQFMDFMWASVQGNHDNMTSNSKTSDNFFRDSHFFPNNGYEGQEGLAYWFRYGDVLFIMLNNEAMHTSAGLEPALEWMEQVVADNPSKYIVVVEHYQWILDKEDSPNNQMARFYEVFDRLGVDLALSGHNHAYRRTFPLREMEEVEPREGTYYVVNSSSDNERGRDLPRAYADNLIEKRWTEGTRTVGGMIMDVNPERIEMTLYDRYGNAKDSFIVPAKR